MRTTYVLKTGIARKRMLRLHHIVLENELVLVPALRLHPVDIIGIVVCEAVEDYRIDADQHGIYSVQRVEDRAYKCSQKNDKAHNPRKSFPIDPWCQQRYIEPLHVFHSSPDLRLCSTSCNAVL